MQGQQWENGLRWAGRGLLALLLSYLTYFFYEERDGLQRLLDFLQAALESLPGFLQEIADYFQALPADTLRDSALLGAGVGALATLLFLLLSQGWLALPKLSPRAYGVGGVVLAAAYLLDFGLLRGVIAGLLALFAFALWQEPDMRRFLRRPIRNFAPEGLTLLGVGGVIGAFVGSVSSQILLYPTRHCTYGETALPPEYRLGLLLTGVSALFLLLPVWGVLARYGGKNRAGGVIISKGVFGNTFGLPYLFLLPTLLSLAVFLYYPAIQLLTLSLKLRIFGAPREQFICLQNYVGEGRLAGLTNDVAYQNSFTLTLSVTVALVVISLGLALMIALLASQKIRGAAIYRTLLIWPYAVSPVVTGVIFLSLFREGGAGLINYGLESLGQPEVNWLSDKNVAPWVVIMAAVWNAVGFNVLFYIAGLQNIPGDLLEAAALDGANRVQRFFRITFPLLSPFTFFLLVTNVTFSFYGIYGAVDVLTQGGPPLGPAGAEGGATEVLIYSIYEQGFASGARIGYGAAQAVVLFLMVASLTFIQFRYLERRVTYSG